MTHDEYIAHFGILGMKWGVRKDKTTGQTKNRKGKKQKEDISTLSDKELRDRINRLQMEKQYSQLSAKEKSAGQKFVSDVLRDASKQIATEYTKKYMKKGIGAVASIAGTAISERSLSSLNIEFDDNWKDW